MFQFTTEINLYLIISMIKLYVILITLQNKMKQCISMSFDLCSLKGKLLKWGKIACQFVNVLFNIQF